MKKLFIFLSLGVIIFFSGCYDQQVFENTAIIIYAGAESSTDNRILFSFGATENEDRKGKLRILSKRDKLMENAIATLNANTEDPLREGKIQHILFSEEFAEKGISKVPDTNRLEASNRFLADYVITEGSPKELMKVLQTKELKSNAYGYLGELLENAASAGLCPNTLYHEFNIDLNTEGIDPILPLITYNSKKETITVKGTALFDEDRMTGILNTVESRYLSLLTASAENVTVKIPNLTSETKDIALHICDMNEKTKVNVKNDTVYITLNLRLTSFFNAGDWATLSDKSKSSITKKTEKTVARRCEKIFHDLQKCNADPFAVEASLRGYHNEFYQTHNGKEAYRNAIVKVIVHNHILNQKSV